jgi:hypothetical protein
MNKWREVMLDPRVRFPSQSAADGGEVRFLATGDFMDNRKKRRAAQAPLSFDHAPVTWVSASGATRPFGTSRFCPLLSGCQEIVELLGEHGDAAGGEVGDVRAGLPHLG